MNLNRIFSLQTLITLDLGNNNITNQGASFLATTLKKNKVENITYESFLCFIFEIFMKTLTSLDLRVGSIDVHGAKSLAMAIKENRVNIIFYPKKLFDICTFHIDIERPLPIK